jgi:hypothetical protein
MTMSLRNRVKHESKSAVFLRRQGSDWGPTRPAGTRVRDGCEKMMLAQFCLEFSQYAGLNHHKAELNPQICSRFYYNEIDVKV